MSKYIIEFKRKNAHAICEYDANQELIKFSLDYGDMTDADKNFLFRNFPRTEALLNQYRQITNVRITEVAFDTTFEAFWSIYANKFGNKARCVKLWNALSEDERIKAIKYIQIYDQWLLKNAGVSKKLPETYLNQNPWNN